LQNVKADAFPFPENCVNAISRSKIHKAHQNSNYQPKHFMPRMSSSRFFSATDCCS